MKFNPNGLTDDEVIDTLVGRRITFTTYISDREDVLLVRSDAPRPKIIENDRGRAIRFFSPEGVRYVQVEKISDYSRKKY